MVMAATDSVICLNQQVCCSGHPEIVSQHPAYLKLFGTQAAYELAVYTHHHEQMAINHNPSSSSAVNYPHG
jgi:zinc transport system ATP-binding protein